MEKKRLLYYRDKFWELMITESLGEDAFKKVEEYSKKRMLGHHALEFAIFDLWEDSEHDIKKS